MSELSDDLKKVNEMIKDVRIAMLTTVDEDGELHSRPMALQVDEFDGDLWFYTDGNSGKAFEIKKEHHVNVAFSDPAHQLYVSAAGVAELVTDKAKIHGKWNPTLEAWFKDGPDTPGITLIQVKVSGIEYWDAPSSTMAHVYGLIKTKILRQTPDVGEHEKISLS